MSDRISQEAAETQNTTKNTSPSEDSVLTGNQTTITTPLTQDQVNTIESTNYAQWYQEQERIGAGYYDIDDGYFGEDGYPANMTQEEIAAYETEQATEMIAAEIMEFYHGRNNQYINNTSRIDERLGSAASIDEQGDSVIMLNQESEIADFITKLRGNAGIHLISDIVENPEEMATLLNDMHNELAKTPNDLYRRESLTIIQGYANDVFAIAERKDAADSIRREYSEMLTNKMAKGNNGLVKAKYVTFGIDAKDLKTTIF